MVVAGALDVNGDSHQDVLVSFPRYNSPAGNNSGIVYLFLGSPTGPSTTPSWSSEGTNVANTAAEPSASTLFGRSVAAGHINGDAFADVVIGQVAWGNGQALEGRVYVFFGQAGASPLPAVASQVLEGRTANAFFGRAVALGNLDGANGDDLVVGSSGFDGNAGRVELYLANAAGGFAADSTPSDSFLGAASSSLGESVTTGDTNGDGRVDVHAAARTQTGARGADEGALYSATTDASGMVGAPFVYTSGMPGGQLGKVAFAGDVNGDGFGDVVAGAPAPNPALSPVGLTRRRSTCCTARPPASERLAAPRCSIRVAAWSASATHSWVAPGSGRRWPARWMSTRTDSSTSSPGRPAGIPPSGHGVVYVIRGSATGPVVKEPYLVDVDSRFNGEAPGDGLGSTVAIAGDVNKDGFVDILAGAAGFEDGAEVDEGKAYLFLGGPATAKMNGHSCTLNGECASGFCVDGFCCNTICGGSSGLEADNTSDCQSCAMSINGGANGTCGIARLGTTCRNSLCLEGSVCDETGACVGGLPRTCPGTQNACRQTGVCDQATGLCTNPPVPDGTTCDDANACTTASTCQMGTCSGTTTVTCPAPALCKLPGACNPATGACSYANIPNGTTCNDGNLCTAGETCQAGACVTTPALTCGAESACKNAGSCDPATGVCAQTSKADGTACEDGNLCTVGSVCLSGSCGPGAARSCDDDNPCTSDSCVAATGCVNAPIASCMSDAGTDASEVGDATGDVVSPGDVPRVDVADGPATDSPVTDGPSDPRPVDSGPGTTPDSAPSDALADGRASDAPGGIGRAGGGGCGCDVGGQPAGGAARFSPVLALALLLNRMRRRRRLP